MIPSDEQARQGGRRMIPPERRITSLQKYIIAGVISALILMIGLPFVIITTSSNYSGSSSDSDIVDDWDIDDTDINKTYIDDLDIDDWDLDETYERGLDNITLIPNWTERIYNGIEVATNHRDADLQVTTFSYGGYISDLIEIVGGPNYIRSSSTCFTDTFIATWRSPRDWGAHNVYILIIFEPETGMIVSKNIMAFSAVTPNSEKIGFALNNIETISDWTADIFHDIMPARRHRDFENNKRTVTSGDYFYDLAEVVGQPTTTSLSTRQGLTTVIAMWTENVEGYRVSVSIEYEQDSGMIVEKELSSR